MGVALCGSCAVWQCVGVMLCESSGVLKLRFMIIVSSVHVTLYAALLVSWSVCPSVAEGSAL